jgi:hypothetical protein
MNLKYIRRVIGDVCRTRCDVHALRATARANKIAPFNTFTELDLAG